MTTTIIGAVEILAGVLFGSIAFIAAGIDALSDTATSAIVFAGLSVSKRRADRGHPYGHRQAETLASMALAIVLALAGVRIAYSAVERFRAGVALEAAPELFLLAGLAVPILGALAGLKIRTGRRTGNKSVVADGYHTLSDSVSAVAVFVGLAFVRLGYPKADSIVALGISALVVWWGASIGRNALNVLMEASPGQEVVADIKRTCLGTPGVLACHKCRARRVGSRILADLHVLVDPELSVEDAHALATRIERRLKARVDGLDSVVVHIEPYRGKPQ